jgi:agmatine deiminase
MIQPSKPGFPLSLGFRMPAEWHAHSCTWLTWPHNPETWPNTDLSEIESVYLQMIQALVKRENVSLLVNNKSGRKHVQSRLKEEKIPLNKVDISILPTNDSWIRDYGPNFLLDSSDSVAMNQWKFDSWGEKYEWDLDSLVAGKIARDLQALCFEPGIILEGGAIDVNGQGLCLTTASCLLNQNRNGGLDRPTMEAFLSNYLGVDEVLWLPGGMQGDDTDGHIDNLVRFVNPTTVLCSLSEDPQDPNYDFLQMNYAALQKWNCQSDKTLEVIPLPVPGAIWNDDERLPASYANFYIFNDGVLLPTFNGPDDAKAHDILQQCFPNREIVDIPSELLVRGLGGIHCLTQQQPAGR